MSWMRSLLDASPLLQFGMAAAGVPRTWEGQDYACKCYLGDDCWPAEATWSEFNATVEGNLHVNVPPGAVCYNVCAARTLRWL